MKKIKDRILSLVGIIAIVVIALFTSSCSVEREDGEPYISTHESGRHPCLYVARPDAEVDDFISCKPDSLSDEEWLEPYFDEDGNFIDEREYRDRTA